MFLCFNIILCFVFFCFAKFSWPVSLTPSNGARKEAHFCLPKYTLHVSMCVRLCNLIKYIEYPKHLHYSILMIARQFYLDFGCVLTTFSFVLTILSKTHVSQLQGSIIYYNVFFFFKQFIVQAIDFSQQKMRNSLAVSLVLLCGVVNTTRGD